MYHEIKLEPFKAIHSQKENHSTSCVSSWLQRSKERSAAPATLLIQTAQKLRDKLGCSVLVTLKTHA